MGSAMCIVQGWGGVSHWVWSLKIVVHGLAAAMLGLSACQQDACTTASQGHLAWALGLDYWFC